MADIVMHRTHHHGLKGARTAAEKMAKKLDEKFDLTSEWEGNTLHFHRSGVNGHLVVTDHDMNLNVTLGFMLKLMKGPIEKAIHEQLEDVLDAAPAASAKAPAKAVHKPGVRATATSAAKKPVTRKK
jgi:putative polyhydroxyalkanoate system protein